MSKAPLPLTLSIWQGQTFDDSLVWKDSAGDPVDLTGYHAEMMARADIADLVPQFAWSDVTGEIVLGTTDGTIAFNVSGAGTSALQSAIDTAVWPYDLKLLAPTGKTDRLIQGVVVIYPAVTRP